MIVRIALMFQRRESSGTAKGEQDALESFNAFSF